MTTNRANELNVTQTPTRRYLLYIVPFRYVRALPGSRAGLDALRQSGVAGWGGVCCCRRSAREAAARTSHILILALVVIAE